MQKLSGIKAIAFDTDGTLVDFEKVMRHSLQITLDELTIHRPPTSEQLDIATMIAIREEVVEERGDESFQLEEIRLESFRRIVAKTGESDESLAGHLYQLYMKHRYEDIELYDDVLPALNELKKNCALGVHSNGNSYPDLCGLEGIFDFSVFPRDFNTEKPDPQFYHFLLAKAGCTPGELLNVGDSLHNDVQAAEDIGIRSVWLNRNLVNNSSEIRVHTEIHSLSELPGLLDT